MCSTGGTTQQIHHRARGLETVAVWHIRFRFPLLAVENQLSIPDPWLRSVDRAGALEQGRLV